MANFLKSSIFCLFLLGCYTPKKAERQLSKAAKYPEKVAQVCSKMFPVVEHTDTLENTEYDFIEVMCEDKIVYVDKIKVDTVVKYVKRTVQVPGKTTIITKTVRDSSELYKLGVEVQNRLKEIEQEKAKGDRMVNISKLLGLLALLLLILLLRNAKRSA